LDYCKSDHRVILLDTNFQSSLGQAKKGPKRFEARWLQERNFKDIVQQAWEKAGDTEASDGVLKAEFMKIA
jgi:hypothetical protein